MNGNKVNLLFPIERLSRELDARLVLGCLHVSARNRILVGQHDALYQMAVKTGMSGGIYVGKNLFRDIPLLEDYRRYREMKRQQFSLVHLHEEGAIFEGDVERWRQILMEETFDPRCLEPEDYVCTWGDFQRDVYQSLKPRCVEHIVTTGHPRFDLLKPQYRKYYERDVAPLTARYGRFVLINTNFSIGNNGLGMADSFSKRVGYDPNSGERRLAAFGRVAYEMRLIADFIKLANRLSLEFPDINIVLRVHPAENQDIYRTAFAGIRNVYVVREGPVIPWLMAAQVLIHNGCTTGLEAHLTGTYVVNFKSVSDAKHDMYLANLFGEECFTEDDAVRSVGLALADPSIASPTRIDAHAHSLMANFHRDAIEALLDVLREVEERQSQVSQQWSDRATQRTERWRVIGERAKSLVRPLFPARQQLHEVFSSHFPGFDQDDVVRRVRTIESMIGKEVQLKFYSSDVLSIDTAA